MTDDKDDIGSKPWRNWTPEELLEFKQEPKTKKDRKRAEAEALFKERPKRETR